MRLWTLHPRYLDPPGLVALWREALLAQAVLLGRTRGYTRHPQLIRFLAQTDPAAVMACYLAAVFEESARRGYRFDREKIPAFPAMGAVPETTGQLLHEWAHLKAKLERRNPEQGLALSAIAAPEPHPLFRLVPGPVQDWERGAGPLRPAPPRDLSGGTGGRR